MGSAMSCADEPKEVKQDTHPPPAHHIEDEDYPIGLCTETIFRWHFNNTRMKELRTILYRDHLLKLFLSTAVCCCKSDHSFGKQELDYIKDLVINHYKIAMDLPYIMKGDDCSEELYQKLIEVTKEMNLNEESSKQLLRWAGVRIVSMCFAAAGGDGLAREESNYIFKVSNVFHLEKIDVDRIMDVFAAEKKMMESLAEFFPNDLSQTNE